jgi:hypothetical protein
MTTCLIWTDKLIKTPLLIVVKPASYNQCVHAICTFWEKTIFEKDEDIERLKENATSWIVALVRGSGLFHLSFLT